MEHIPENAVRIIDRADVHVVSGPLSYAEENQAEIVANWTRERAVNPTLFDGEVYLAPEARLAGGRLEAGFRRTSFATLMHWRRHEVKARPWHIFGVGVIVSSDGYLIAGRMGDRTAAAGRIYFPAGSVDDKDIADKRVDYEANCRREVLEETGLDLREARAEQQINLVTGNRSIALFRRHYFAMPSSELVSRIELYLSSQAEPELSEIILVKAAGAMGDDTPSYVRAFADWHFNNL
ncbi:NUDIX hydrolase [Brucella daejeonensis]|nr:NUDIX hydrolase [Brucella daejeonensis]